MSDAIASLRANPNLENAIAAVQESRLDTKITKAEVRAFVAAADEIIADGSAPKVALEFLKRVSGSYPKERSLSWIGTGDEAFVPAGSEHEPNYDRLLRVSVENLMSRAEVKEWVRQNPSARDEGFIHHDISHGLEVATHREPVRAAVQSAINAVLSDPSIADRPGYRPLDAAFAAFREAGGQRLRR